MGRLLTGSSRLLGNADDALLLIVNADDFGMSAAVNRGVLASIRRGVAQAASLVVPWPGVAQAMATLRENPDVSFGLHLSVSCDVPGYRACRSMPTRSWTATASIRPARPRYLRLLSELPAGLTEWALHPAVDTAELRETEPASWPVRVTDYEFLVCPGGRQVIEREGIIPLSHEPLRRVRARPAGRR